MTHEQEKEVNHLIEETRLSALRYYRTYYSERGVAEALDYAHRTVQGIRFDATNQVLGIK